MKEKLQEWISRQEIKEEMIWRQAAYDQFMFVRDYLGYMVTKERDKVFVISEHTSKSIRLPVYLLEGDGIRITLRYNFYNWKMSVDSDEPVEANFEGLFHTTPPIEPDYTGDELHAVYFEGFKDEWIFGYYLESDKKQWSAEICDKFLLWTAIFLIMKSLGKIKPFKWHTQESHRKELDEQTAKWDAGREAKWDAEKKEREKK